jgi:hypothetical protein
MELKSHRNTTMIPSDSVMLKQSSYNELRPRLELLVADNESMRTMLSNLIPALRRLQKVVPTSIPSHVTVSNPADVHPAPAFHSSPQKLSSSLIPHGFVQQQQPALRVSGPVPSTQPLHALPSNAASLRLSRSSTNGVLMRSSASSAMPLNAQGYFMA